MDQQQHGAAEVAVATDPRLLEWFVAPTSPSSSHPSLSLSSHSRGVHIAGHSASQGAASSKHSKNALLSRAEERRQTSTLPATLRKSISKKCMLTSRGRQLAHNCRPANCLYIWIAVCGLDPHPACDCMLLYSCVSSHSFCSCVLPWILLGSFLHTNSIKCFFACCAVLGCTGISLSALRRGCADRLNFCRRLQSDLLQCSLSPSALELLLCGWTHSKPIPFSFMRLNNYGYTYLWVAQYLHTRMLM